MSDIIKVLPDHIANQIAAGEVVQRPSSAVKELIENSIDAGSTKIQLYLKEAGKTLIQVIDNGCGMSDTDARLSYERHATSKIASASDLFHIKTKGFRGEAMASIAAIAQVEMLTKLHDQAIGTKLEIEGNKVISQTSVSCPSGTHIQVKNLFFNIPARRKFLKSNPVELRHCIDEFQRVALAHPEVEMKMVHNNEEIYHLPSETRLKRIIHIMGKSYESSLIPVQEQTDIVSISGLLAKPEQARKTKGDQFIFVNNRFIRSNYFNHAIKAAFEAIIPENYYPSYFLFLEIDPQKIDINIHPTKTEIKFEDEKYIYSLIFSAVKRAIAQYSLIPSLDFETEQSFQVPVFDQRKPIKAPTISSNHNFNPFESQKENNKISSDQWQDLYSIAQQDAKHPHFEPEEQHTMDAPHEEQLQLLENENKHTESLFVIDQKYIASKVKSGFLFIHIQRAWERILYDRFSKLISQPLSYTQQLLFPITITFSTSDFLFLKSNSELFHKLGFEFEEFGKDTFIYRGIPTDIDADGVQGIIEEMLEQLKEEVNVKLDSKDRIIPILVKNLSKRIKKIEGTEDLVSFVETLFRTSNPEFNMDKKRILYTLNTEMIHKFFND